MRVNEKRPKSGEKFHPDTPSNQPPIHMSILLSLRLRYTVIEVLNPERVLRRRRASANAATPFSVPFSSPATKEHVNFGAVVGGRRGNRCSSAAKLRSSFNLRTPGERKVKTALARRTV